MNKNLTYCILENRPERGFTCYASYIKDNKTGLEYDVGTITHFHEQDAFIAECIDYRDMKLSSMKEAKNLMLQWKKELLNDKNSRFYVFMKCKQNLIK